MTADSSAASTPLPSEAGIERQPSQVCFKTEAGQLLLLLPQAEVKNIVTDWPDLWQQLQQRLSAGKRFWQPHTGVYLVAANRLLDARQLQAIAEILAEVQLQLKAVRTSRRQTAVAAATAGYSVEQQSPLSTLNQSVPTAPALADPFTSRQLFVLGWKFVMGGLWWFSATSIQEVQSLLMAIF